MQALILAAGFGTRLYPLTRDVPKALIRINEKPIIEYIIEKVKEAGVEKVYVLSNNRFYPDFLEWFNNYETGVKIKILNNSVNYEYEKEGAVSDFKFSLKFLDNEDLFLLASDNLFDFSLKPLLELSEEKNASSVVLRKTDNPEIIKSCNHIFLDDGKIIFYEEKPKNPKSNIFSTACYYLKKKDVEKIKKHSFRNNDNFGEIISFLYKQRPVYGKIFDGFWADIGSREQLEEVKKYFEYS
jgi:glucose-1-phosphate thymidylyltransferase